MAKTVNQNAVSVLPPTIGIKDPSTRSFLDALTNILDARSGYTDRDAPERFITAAEFQGLATRAISRAFSGAGALPGDPDGKIPSAIEVQESIENLAESIRKSLIYQILGEQFGLIDVEQIRQNITQLIGRADGLTERADGLTERADDIISRVDEIVIDLETGFTEEREARTDADESLTSSLNAAVSRIGAAEAAIINEQTTRANADSAMTSSLNVAVSRIGAAESAILTEKTTRASADSAITTSVAAAVSRLGAAESAIVAEQTTRANADSALTTSMNAAVSRIGAAESAIVAEQTTRANADSAITTSVAAAVSRIGAAESAIASEQTTRASADAALTTSLNSAVSRIGASESAIVAEQTTRASADAALTSTVSAVTARVGAAESAIASEQTTRSTKDMSLASAINTLWAEVGGAGSVIQDGSLASATPSSTQATKWRQVQSAVTDPNTGLVASAAMREDFTTYASNVDGRFNALYSVRAQLSTGGVVLSGIAATGPTASLAGSTALRLSANAPVGTAPGMYVYGTGLDGLATVVGVSGAVVTLSRPLGLNAAGAYTFTTNKMLIGGFGLAAIGGSGSSQGGTIDFGVRADKFFIAATSETPDAATQVAQGSSIPFMVLTSSQVVNGVVYQPGVYLKKATIGSATIGEAQIADLAVTNAKIGETIQSNNFWQGVAGWRITKSGLAEFNDVIIRRASLIASGYTERSDTIYGSYSISVGNKGGTMIAYHPPGSFLRGSTFYIETGFTDFEAVANAYSAGFYGRIESPSNGLVMPGSLSGNVYELAFEVIAAPARTWAIIGSGTPGQRVVLCVTPIIKVLQSFNSVTVNNYNWALLRQR